MQPKQRVLFGVLLVLLWKNERKKKRNRATTKNTNQHFYTQAHSITTVAQSNKHDHTSVPHKDE
jgi:hypothetical protein